MSEKKISSIDKNSNLCRLCEHGRIRRNVGFVCELTDDSPNFYIFCPYFKVFKARDDKIHGKNSDSSLEKLFFGLAFSFIFTLILISFNQLIIALLFFSIGIILYSIYYSRLPNKLVPELGWFAYLYLVIIGYVLQKKTDYSESDIDIVKQQIIKFMGRKKIAVANEIFKKESKKLFSYNLYVSKLNIQQINSIFSMVCQLYVYDNIADYTKDSMIKQIAEFLGIDSSTYLEIKNKYAQAEVNFIQQRNKFEEKQKYQKKQNGRTSGRRVYSFSSSKYYSILGLNKNTSDDQIKKRFRKLALKFHPDKYVSFSEIEQEKALEKFKEISQAYNYLKDLRGF